MVDQANQTWALSSGIEGRLRIPLVVGMGGARFFDDVVTSLKLELQATIDAGTNH